MDRAVIADTYSFIGFSFCKALLDQGVTVIGINEINDAFILDKQLEIGRNANFTETDLTAAEILIDKESFIFVDLYSMFVDGLLPTNKLYTDFLSLIKNVENKVVLTLPIQWLSVDSPFIKEIKSMRNKVYSYYLPTVYGPFQPKTLLFQQAFLMKMKQCDQMKLNYQEWRHDAIYIEDVTDAILFSVKNDLPDERVLKSSIDNHWLKCAQYLDVEKDLNNESAIIDGNEGRKIKSLIVKNRWGLHESLDKQREHLSFLLNS